MADKIFAKYSQFFGGISDKLEIGVLAWVVHSDGTIFTFNGSIAVPLTGIDTSETVELRANQEIRAAFVGLPITTPIVWLPRAGII